MAELPTNPAKRSVNLLAQLAAVSRDRDVRMGHAARLGSASRLLRRDHVEPEQSAANCAGRRARARIWPVGTATASPPPRRSALRPACASLAPVAAGERDHPARLPGTLSLASSPRLLRPAPPPLAPRGPAQLCPGRVAVAAGCSAIPDTKTHSSRAQGASAAKSLGRRKGGGVC